MPPLTIHIGQTIVINRAALHAAHPSLERQIIQRLTFPNPEFKGRRGRVSADVPEHIREYGFVGPDLEWLRVQRGAIALVQRVMKLYQREVVFDTSRIVSRCTGPGLDPLAVDPLLRDYQQAAARALIRSVQGVVSIPTGGGKTRTLSAAIRATMEPAIVLCHTSDIFDQWVERFREMGVKSRRVQGGGSDFGPLAAGEIAVATIQTIARDMTRASALLGSAGCVVFDECHHLTAATWRMIAEIIPARFRWGCTATEEREDGLGVLLELLVGPVVYKIHARELISQGYLQAPSIIPVRSGWRPQTEHYFANLICPGCGRNQRTTFRRLLSGGGACKFRSCLTPWPPDLPAETGRLNYSDAQTDSASDPSVTTLTVTLAEMGVSAGRTVLVLAPRVAAVKSLADLLRRRGVPAIGVTGGMNATARRDAIARVRDGTCPVLVATTLADEGLDISALDMGVNLMSGKAKGKARQRMGRIIRLGGQEPLLFEIVHGGEYMAQWDRRRRAYVETFGQASVFRTLPVSPDEAYAVLQRKSSR